jgi:septal ring factor EnvC (AmiA/AmiB activator)
LKEKINGSSVSYTARDAARDMIGKVTVVSQPIAATTRFLLKFAAVGLLTCLAVFVVLFVTMEKEEGLVKEIEAIRKEIQKSEAAVPGLQEELQRLQARIDSVTEDDLGRKDEIEFVELNMQAHQVAERLERTQIEVEQYQKRLDQNLIRLEEMRSKSLLERLLRI